MKRGRKPKSPEQKRLEGNPGKRSLPETAAAASAKDIPKMPEHLSGLAAAEWRRIVPELAAVGRICELDRALLSAYCSAWGNWVTAQKAIEGTGPVQTAKNGWQVASPHVNIAQQAFGQMVKIGHEFGFSPSARGMVFHDAPKAATPAETPFIFRRKAG